MCRDPGRAWDGECRGIWKSYSTWINLSAKAALSYQAKGVPSNGGKEAEQKAGDRRGGETDKNHLSLTQWATSRSRG